MQDADDSEDDARRARAGLGSSARRLVSALAHATATLIVPPVCIACHAPLATYDSLCAACWQQIAFVHPPLCDRLGIPLSIDTGGPQVSAAALANPPAFDRTRAAAVFAGPMQQLIHRFKYSDTHDARRLFGRWLVLAGATLLAEADILIPVPLNRWRLMERRYNQAAILSNEVSRLSGVAVAPLALERIKATVSQVGLSTAERRRNVAGAFRVPRSRRALIEGRRVLLIDDVITTGATLDAAASVLKAGGATAVDALALAIVTHTVS